MRRAGFVDILWTKEPEKQKQIPHPAKTAGIRDDKWASTPQKRTMSTEPDEL
jgi:hypothetical protein